MGDTRDLLRRTADLAADFLDTLDSRPVFPSATPEELRAALGGPLPDESVDAEQVIEELVATAEPGVVAMPSGRYFGFVIGGAVPVSVAADWLTTAWDQNAGLYVGGPSAAVAEEVAGAWLADLLGIPPEASFAFVTGSQMAHVTALAAARHQVLAQAGWDVRDGGLAGAPPIRVLLGAKSHVTVERALRLLGIGRSALVGVPVDGQGRMLVEPFRATLSEGRGPTIVCVQAGEVNTGSFDPLAELVPAARETGAWVHVDGAFGLWAAASPRLRHLVAGAELADSWSVDAHKWLNVPYDSGLAFCRHAEAHRAAIGVSADYLIQDDRGLRDQVDWTPEFSRRARGFATYAALRSLGRRGVVDMIERSCEHARRLADGLVEQLGVELLNEVALNQVLFRFESDERTEEVLQRVQESGDAWMSGTLWDERRAIRLSVSNWQTSEEDVERTLAAFRAAVYAGQAPAR